MNSFDDFLLQQIREKDKLIAQLRYELAVRRAAMGELEDLSLMPCEEQVQ